MGFKSHNNNSIAVRKKMQIAMTSASTTTNLAVLAKTALYPINNFNKTTKAICPIPIFTARV